MFLRLVFALLLATCWQAEAQTVLQSGSITPGHATKWVTNGLVGDAGTAADGSLTSIGTRGAGDTICANSGPITGAFARLCIGANATGHSQISFFNYNGSTSDLVANINGTLYPFPFVGPGTSVLGPPSTVVNDLACWNNTNGTLLSDCGTSYIASRSALAALVGPFVVGRSYFLSETPRQGWFYWSSANLSTGVARDAGQCVYVPPASDPTGASGSWVRAAFGGKSAINVQWCGADPTDTADTTTPLQNAINFWNVGRGAIYAPTGIYKVVTGGVTFAQSRVAFYGDGRGATIFDFEPTGTADMFHVEASAAIITEITLREFSFYSNDTTFTKTGIHMIDASEPTVQNVSTVAPHLFGNTSVALKINGREVGRYENLTLAANIPIEIGPITAPHVAAGIGLDQTEFHNLYLISTTSNPLIQVDDGTILAQVSFTGQQAWVGGGRGFSLATPSVVSPHTGLLFQNVRGEQTADASQYLFYFSSGGQIQGVTIQNGTDSDRNLVYARNTFSLTIGGFVYDASGGTVLNVDSTDNGVVGINNYINTGAVASYPGQSFALGTPIGFLNSPLPQTFVMTNGVQSLNTMIGPVVSSGAGITLLNNANANLVTMNGLAFVTGSASTISCVFALRNGNNAVGLLVNDTAGCSTTSANPGTTNVFWNGSHYVIENKTGLSETYYVTYSGRE